MYTWAYRYWFARPAFKCLHMRGVRVALMADSHVYELVGVAACLPRHASVREHTCVHTWLHACACVPAFTC
eukprot:6172813-Pleurochrysis_carterae.AAC.3